MRRLSSLFIALWIIISNGGPASAFVTDPLVLMSSGGGGSSQSIASTSISCDPSCGGTAGTGSTVGTLAATLSPPTPPFNNTSGWSLQTTGTVGGTSCDNSGFFSVSGNSLNISSSATAATYHPCYVATQAGLGGSPFANVVTVVVNTGGNIACTIGPNFAGSVPAGAAAAGFTACAANYDFSNPALASLSSWLDCAGASTPILFNEPNSGGNGSPCSAYSMVTDGSTQALHSIIPAGTNTGSGKYATISTINPAHNAGQLFPQTMYIQFSYRLTSTDNAACGPTGCDALQFFAYQGSSPPSNVPWVEWDYMEVYDGTDTSPRPLGQSSRQVLNNTINVQQWLQVSYTNQAPDPGWAFRAQADQTVYHDYALRIVSDGAASLDGSTGGNITVCPYLAGSQLGCVNGSYFNNAGSPQDTFVLRLLITMQNVINAAISSLPGDHEIYMKYVRVWECPTWQAATPQTANGNNCLNTTADVNGKLTHAP